MYLDEDTIDKALIKALRDADLDIVTVAEARRLGLPDETQLLWATEQKRVIYSYNIGDFCRLHRDFMLAGNVYAGIILVSQRDYSIGQRLRGLLKLVDDKSAAVMVNQLVFLNAYIGRVYKVVCVKREIVTEEISLQTQSPTDSRHFSNLGWALPIASSCWRLPRRPPSGAMHRP